MLLIFGIYPTFQSVKIYNFLRVIGLNRQQIVGISTKLRLLLSWSFVSHSCKIDGKFGLVSNLAMPLYT